MIELEKQFEQLIQDQTIPPKLLEAMRYSFFAKSKHLRPKLVLATTQDLSASRELAMPLALAVELIHTYSLVHDDLPSMDDDDMRRGQPSSHIAFDEATAILVGDAMQALAFESIATSKLPAASIALATRLLARAVGPAGMVGGQVMDLSPKRDLKALHHAKTGALFACSIALGAIAAKRIDLIEPLTKYGLTIGLAFQVIDDVLDVTSSVHILGKEIGRDEAQGKYTFVNEMGVENAQNYAAQLLDEAGALLDQIDVPFERLKKVSRLLVDRVY